MSWSLDFSKAPLHTLVLVKLTKPIDLGSYGPPDCHFLLAEFYGDGRFSYCGSPAVERIDDYAADGWREIPD